MRWQASSSSARTLGPSSRSEGGRRGLGGRVLGPGLETDEAGCSTTGAIRSCLSCAARQARGTRIRTTTTTGSSRWHTTDTRMGGSRTRPSQRHPPPPPRPHTHTHTHTHLDMDSSARNNETNRGTFLPARLLDAGRAQKARPPDVTARQWLGRCTDALSPPKTVVHADRRCQRTASHWPIRPAVFRIHLNFIHTPSCPITWSDPLLFCFFVAASRSAEARPSQLTRRAEPESPSELLLSMLAEAELHRSVWVAPWAPSRPDPSLCVLS